MVDIQEHLEPRNLERYAFYWSLARMVIAAFSLFFGAMPIVYNIFGYASSVASLLPLFWLISGAASIYLIYAWYTGGRTVFGGTEKKDLVAFFIMALTGLNLGYAAIGANVGMSLVWDAPIADVLFKATAIVYLVVAFYLWKRWKENDERMVGAAAASATQQNDALKQETQQQERIERQSNEGEGGEQRNDDTTSQVNS